ncbi:hypothetical protein ID866_10462 [Astraeus odoratus]|nr:hypothetical protein ID866_10462 [Astraeus odoratus]
MYSATAGTSQKWIMHQPAQPWFQFLSLHSPAHMQAKPSKATYTECMPGTH